MKPSLFYKLAINWYLDLKIYILYVAGWDSILKLVSYKLLCEYNIQDHK